MSDDKRAFPKLNSNNYGSWVDNAESFLGTKGLFGLIDGSDPEPSPLVVQAPTAAEAKETSEWKQRKAKCSGEIWLMVEENQKPIIKKDKGEPKAMWSRLRERYVQKKSGTRFDAYSDLFSIRLQENESLSDLVTRVDAALSAIKERRPLSFTIDDLDAELSSMTLIKALPFEFENFVTFLTLGDDLSLNHVTTAFSNEEQSCRRRAQENGDNPQLAMAAALKPLCYFCDSPSHIVRDCPEMKAASSLAKQKSSGSSLSSPSSSGAQGKRGSRGRGRERGAAANEAQGGASTSSSAPQEESAGHASALSSSARPAWLRSRTATDWNTDTGTSSHMTPHRHWFRSYSPHVVPVRLADDSVIYSQGMGSVEFVPVVNS